MVLWFMAEGVDLSVMVRYTGYSDATLARWLTRAGQHSTHLHDLLFRGLIMPLVQMDELYARVRGAASGRLAVGGHGSSFQSAAEAFIWADAKPKTGTPLSMTSHSASIPTVCRLSPPMAFVLTSRL